MQTPLRISPTNKVGNASFGCCTTLSADGGTAVIGGYGDNNGVGAAWVFIRSDGIWIQQAKLVGGTGSRGFGASVALSADGYTLLIGDFTNAAWIFSRSDADVWEQKGVFSGVGGFGHSVALSFDGNVALIGAVDEDTTGAAWVYIRTGNVWDIGGVKLVAPDAGLKGFGQSVALSADGDIALIGASGVSNDEGSAWVFTSTPAPSGPDDPISAPANQWLPGVKLPERSDRGNSIGFGSSVALSADGDVALVSCFANDPNQSGAWVFSNLNNVWSQQGPKLAGSNPLSYGQSVALSADGTTAMVSDWSESTGGVGWLFTFDGTAWKQPGEGLTGTPNQFSGFSIGASVAISANAKTYLVCGYDQQIDDAAFLYDESSGVITHVFVLMLENHSFDNMFSRSGINGITSTASTTSNTYDGQTYSVSGSAPSIMPTDPAHEFADIMEQQCGLTAQQSWQNGQPYPKTITNEGFVSNYATSITEIHSGNPVVPTEGQRGEIMKCFDTATQLPVIYQLATQFALCDQWFAALPGPTFPNRAFLHGGSSSGLADSPTASDSVTWAAHGFQHARGNIFAALNDKGIVWKIFVDPPSPLHFMPPPVCLLKGIHYVSTYSFTKFAAMVQSPTYPQGYTFIEPSYGEVFSESFRNGSSQHPMDGTYGGEMLIKKTYEAIRNSPHWNDSVLIITYDEHGGFFDSGKPGGDAPAPNDNPTKDPKFNYAGLTNFDFKQYGVRVPAVVVSPRIVKGTVDHTLYDHTSVLATLKHFFSIPHLTDRDATANTVAHLLSGPLRAEDDCPKVLNNPVPPQPVLLERAGVTLPYGGTEFDLPAQQKPLPAVGNVHGFLAALLKTDLEITPDPAARAAILAEFKLIKTMGEAQAYAMKVGAKVATMRDSDNPVVAG